MQTRLWHTPVDLLYAQHCGLQMALKASSVQQQLRDSQPDLNVMLTATSSQVRTTCYRAPDLSPSWSSEG